MKVRTFTVQVTLAGGANDWGLAPHGAMQESVYVRFNEIIKKILNFKVSKLKVET